MTNSFFKLKLPELKAVCKAKKIIVLPVTGKTKGKADHIVALQDEQIRVELEPRSKELEASLKEARAKWDYYKGRTKEECEMVHKLEARVKRRDTRIKALEAIAEEQGKMLPKAITNPKTPAKAVVAQEAANKSIQISAFKDFEVNGLKPTMKAAAGKSKTPTKAKKSPVKKRSPAPKKHYRSPPENPSMSQDVCDLMAGELKRCGY